MPPFVVPEYIPYAQPLDASRTSLVPGIHGASSWGSDPLVGHVHGPSDRHSGHHWGHQFERQAARAPLADRYWERAGGRPGMRVAEVGCGAGYFALRYAAMTGPTGHVHAVDASEEALASLRARLDARHHAHVTLERLDIERAPLPELHFHALFVTDMLHHVAGIPRALRNLRASGARMVVAEFDPAGPGDIGPPLDERLAPDALLAALRAAGWDVGAVERAAYEHYLVVAQP